MKRISIKALTEQLRKFTQEENTDVDVIHISHCSFVELIHSNKGANFTQNISQPFNIRQWTYITDRSMFD